MGIIPSGQENHSKTEHLNFPGGELSVINITEQYKRNIYIYIYIYIYICVCVCVCISLKKKTNTGYFRIINLFLSWFLVSGVNQKHEEKYNRTSSDPMDK